MWKAADVEQLLDEQPVADPIATATLSLRDRLSGGNVRSAHDVVDRGMVWLALVWQALWFIGDPRLWPMRQSSSLSAIMLGATVVTWFVMLIVHVGDFRRWQPWARVLDVAALFAASAVVLIASASSSAPDWSAASSIAVLPGGVAGLLFALPVAVGWLLASVAMEAVIISGSAASLGAQADKTIDILYPAFALSIGIVSLAARYVLIRDANRVDVAALLLMDAEQHRLTAEGGEAALRREERILHETVLNTLTAVVRGGLNTSALRQRLRERCREAATVLRSITREPVASSHAQQSLAADLDDLIGELRAAGLTVHVEIDVCDELPADVYQALRSATREALTNVHRHAEARSVSITATRGVDSEGESVRVVVNDDGRGFDSSQATSRFGVQSAVVRALADVGGTARVESAPGTGTTVVVAWRAASSTASSLTLDLHLAAFAIPLMLSLGIFITLALVLTRGDIVRPMSTALAYLLYVGTAIMLGWVSARGRIPGWAVMTTVAIAPLIYHLQGTAVADVHNSWADWASLAIVSLFMVCAGAGPFWAWLVVLVTWLLIQGDVLHELLASGSALLIAAALFGRSTRRNAEALLQARQRAAEQQSAEGIARAGLERIRQRYGELRHSEVIDLLDDLAGGKVDPEDPRVQMQAAVAEGYVRTLIRVDPLVDDVHHLAVELAARAMRRGLLLDVRVADVPEAQGMVDQPTQASLLAAIDHSEPGGSARLSGWREGHDYVIRLITPIVVDDREAISQLAVPGVLLEPVEPDMLWEVRLPDGVGADAHQG